MHGKPGNDGYPQGSLSFAFDPLLCCTCMALADGQQQGEVADAAPPALCSVVAWLAARTADRCHQSPKREEQVESACSSSQHRDESLTQSPSAYRWTMCCYFRAALRRSGSHECTCLGEHIIHTLLDPLVHVNVCVSLLRHLTIDILYNSRSFFPRIELQVEK